MQLIQLTPEKIIDLDSIIEAKIVCDRPLTIRLLCSGNSSPTVHVKEDDNADKLWKILEGRSLTLDECAEEFGIEFE